jgi:hypothetical protein
MQLLQETMRRREEEAWPTFFHYARLNWPGDPRTVRYDACQFCRGRRPEHLAMVSQAEWNRLNFAFSERQLSIYASRCKSKAGRSRPRVQIFVRGLAPKWYEFDLFLKLG